MEFTQVACRALSLGAGVQSSVLALLLSREDSRLAEHGFEKPDVAIFADTGWEPDYVYEHLDWLEKQLTYPFERVKGGDIKEALWSGRSISGHKFSEIPLFTITSKGKKAMLMRQCTNHYKIQPIFKRVKELSGGVYNRPFPKGKHAEVWLGISRDEIDRIKPSREMWIETRWPLIDIRFSRQDCLDWFEENYPGRKLPRSACVICPYRSRTDWLDVRENDPEGFAEAVRLDKYLRDPNGDYGFLNKKGDLFLHSSCLPLDEAVERNSTGLFGEECAGYCGL